MSKMKVYCVHPISGTSAEEVFGYYERTKEALTELGYNVLTPMYGKGQLRTELEFKAHGYENNPLATNRAIFGRDRWMVEQADILYANLLGAGRVSIGSCFELAWGSDLRKQVVLVMEKDNIHRHAFVLEAATVIFEDEDSALAYLAALSNKEL
jgi:nucleoside 2-deoxyribosyltransferase